MCHDANTLLSEQHMKVYYKYTAGVNVSLEGLG